jgi:hypothetical protein
MTSIAIRVAALAVLLAATSQASAVTSPSPSIVTEKHVFPRGAADAPAAGRTGVATAACAQGAVALGAGWLLSRPDVRITASSRAGATGWTVRYVPLTPSAATVGREHWLVRLEVQCLRGAGEDAKVTEHTGKVGPGSAAAIYRLGGVSCPAGTLRVGGGFRWADPGLALVQSSPTPLLWGPMARLPQPGNSWVVGVGPGNNGHPALAVVECLSSPLIPGASVTTTNVGLPAESGGAIYHASCPGGTSLAAGGFANGAVQRQSLDGTAVRYNRPAASDPGTWTVRFDYPPGQLSEWAPTYGQAVCLTVR